MTENRGEYEEAHVLQVTETLQNLAGKIRSAGDEGTAKKFGDILEKWQKQQLNIGFCGHFSAGKSTMINRLLQKSILPASPIPTSANLVVIRAGSPKAVISMTDGEHVEIAVEQIEQWKEYCKDGQQVERVDIYDESPLLEQGLQLLDTPGIDSTDEAHQAATEAALHLADIIFFVTDYNHVQSELNFEFIRSLKEKGKTLVLIINQIDKHQEQEIPFTTFHARIMEGLKEWGIKLDALVYTSMKQESHPLNAFDQLYRMLELFKQDKLQWLRYHILENSKALLKEHQSYSLEQQQLIALEQRQQLEQLKHELNWVERASWYAKYEQDLQRPVQWSEQLKLEAAKILDNAIITPYVTTQLAQEYITSRQKSFKVGLLFSSKKTEEERKKRLDALYTDLQERIVTQIEWHLKELLRKTAEGLGIQEQSFIVDIHKWSVPLPVQLLEKTVQEGIVSNDYVYTYTKALVQEIRRLYTQEMEQWRAKGAGLLERLNSKQYAGHEQQLAKYQHMQELDASLRMAEEEIKEGTLTLLRRLSKLQEQGYSAVELVEHLSQVQEEYKQKGSQKKSGASQPEEALSGHQWKLGKEVSNTATESQPVQRAKVESFMRLDSLHKSSTQLEHTAGGLLQAKGILEGVEATQALRTDMEAKAERLKANRFRVCLFGAFSAGKSSFANALLGEAVLPVSPNPTTAAINQVLPPTAQQPSGTAVIKMKPRKQLEEEIQIALERLQLNTTGFIQEQLERIKQIDPHQLRGSLKPYYTFLAACLKGWQEAEAILDSEFQTQHQEYKEYVAVEHKACFVESIQLYHDNPVTAQGIEIIDTPGADSIYSRHTNVTFNYLKHADVIIYVTYYNHAFSRADRQFLDQLGRVKDQFALDKMFFLVNAADLASSADELQAVVQHVEENLLRSGIRFPRIFPVSSLLALQGKADQGMQQFIQAFTSFIEEDLTQLLVASGKADIQYGREWLQELQTQLLSSQADKEQRITKLEQFKKNWHSKIGERSYLSLLNEIEQEVREHTFHIKQRLAFKFLEHVQEAFHPSVLSGKGVSAGLLYSSLEECVFSVSFQLQEELKATSLRLEGFLHKLVQREASEWQKQMRQEGFVLPEQSYKIQDLGLPPISKNLGFFTDKEAKEILKHFKTPKQFFEGEGRDLLRAELETKINVLVDHYLQDAQATYASYYQAAWQSEEQSFKQRVLEEVDAVVAGQIAALKGEIKPEELNEIIRRYDAVVESMDGLIPVLQ